jgi:hypothetical protein
MTTGTKGASLCALAMAIALARGRLLAQTNGAAGLYDPRPDHIWNRLHAVLYLRTDSRGRSWGGDELDPLLWIRTNHLLTGPSHQAALAVLDEFLATAAEQKIRSPLARAILQRDLWAVFDWCVSRSDEHPAEARELESRLAQIMRRVALSAEEVQALPENYSAAVHSHALAVRYDPVERETPFLPPDLFDPKGPWACIGLPYGEPLAVSHTYFVRGRSSFLVFLHLPDGREATLDYLHKLRDAPHLWRLNPDYRPGTPLDEVVPAADLPQFPAGTQLALVRRLILVNSRGELMPAPITESLQIRVYRSIEDDMYNRRYTQDGFEFRLSREKLLRSQSGGLYALDRNSKEFPLFMSHGFDEFEKPMEPGPIEDHLRPALLFCGSCHQRNPQMAGIYSVLSYAESFSRGEYQRPVRMDEISPEDAARFTVDWKRGRYDWGLLAGLWQSTSWSATHPAGGKAGSAASPR